MGDCRWGFVNAEVYISVVGLRVPSAEVCSSISEASPSAVGRIENLRIEAAPVVGGVGEAEFTVLPGTVVIWTDG